MYVCMYIYAESVCPLHSYIHKYVYLCSTVAWCGGRNCAQMKGPLPRSSGGIIGG